MDRSKQVELVDAFLAEPKILSGAPPEFGPMKKGHGGPMRTATWPIADLRGVVQSGKLNVNHCPSSNKPFTLAVVFRDECVARLDFVDQGTCHSNPLWARDFGLPPIVCGPHFHPWAENRRAILDGGPWELKARIALQPQIRRFEQAFLWLADHLNLTLTNEQRLFALPPELV
jgi:hypothetical protein